MDDQLLKKKRTSGAETTMKLLSPPWFRERNGGAGFGIQSSIVKQQPGPSQQKRMGQSRTLRSFPARDGITLLPPSNSQATFRGIPMSLKDLRKLKHGPPDAFSDVEKPSSMDTISGTEQKRTTDFI
ncbi:MAG: hypothetical protein JNM43_19400 [Planctomycetaceae bacterium]|nr:hypothetical protein [Planctomycetaceae bacterium]